MQDPAGIVQPVLKVVLVSPRNPLNIGAAARAMSNFGFRHLRLVKPYDVAFRGGRLAVTRRPELYNQQLVSKIGQVLQRAEAIRIRQKIGEDDCEPALRIGAQVLTR